MQYQNVAYEAPESQAQEAPPDQAIYNQGRYQAAMPQVPGLMNGAWEQPQGAFG